MLLNYKYAFDESNELINIEEVDKKNKGKYFCLDCGNELIARKGEIKVHHFSHKAQFNCNYESYLHKLAKYKFYKEYTNCLQKNIPFGFQYNLRRTCTTCKEINPINSICEIKGILRTFDLTKTFDKITIEKGFSGFVADILLESTKSDHVIFIEFAVKHDCEITKKESGIRIIEFKVQSEDDLNFIDQRFIPYKSEKNSLFSFKIPHDFKEIFNLKQCAKKYHVFTVSLNGNCGIDRLSTYKLSKSKANELLYLKILKHDPDTYLKIDDFESEVVDASMLGINVKDCFACRFSVINYNYNCGYRDPFQFCKKHKAIIDQTLNAKECRNFWRLERIIQNESH